jgi:hypothetical protein
VDEISVAVDDIIRQKMDAAWVVVCERFNIPYDGKTLSSQSSKSRSVSKSRSISPTKRSSLGGERIRRPTAPVAAVSPNSSIQLDYALQRAMKAVPDGLKVYSPAKGSVYDRSKVNAPVKEVTASPSRQHVGSTDHLNYSTPPRQRRRSEPMQVKNTTGSRAQLFISNASVLK